MSSPSNARGSSPQRQPRKRLPVNPSIEHLKKQAKRLAAAASDPPMQLADAQHQLAREYGCTNWAELARVVETMSRGASNEGVRIDEMAPLPAAARQRDLAAVQRVLAHDDFTQHDLDLALARATLHFQPEMAKLLIEHGADPNGQYGSNYGPIILATGEGLDADGMEFLIDHGADVSFAPLQTKYGPASPLNSVLGSYTRGKNEAKHRMIDMLLARGAHVPPAVTPLFMAIHRGDVAELAKFLDEEPSLVSRRFAEMPYGNLSLRGATLLHMAVEFGEIECIDLLLARGAQINAQAEVTDGVGGQTPIFHAIASPVPGGNLRALEHLVNHTGRWIDMSVRAAFTRWDKKDAGPLTPMEFAEQVIADKNHAELQLLRQLRRPRIDDRHFASAVAAIDAGDLDRLRTLLREHPRLVTMSAEESGSFAGPYFAHPKLLWFVAENPTRTGRLPANITAIAGAIIDAGAIHEDISYTAMLVGSSSVAREAGMQTPLLELLVRREADPSAALSAAVQHGERDAVATLLQLGAQPDLPSAAGIGDLDAMRTALRGNVSAEAKLLALYSAATRGQTEAIALLVTEAGVDVNSRVGLGTTALHLAAHGGHAATVDCLLALGTDRTMRDARFNSTPADWAEHGGHPALAEKLRRG